MVVLVGKRGPCPCEYDDLATAWTSSASAHPATTLLALPVLSSLPCPVREQGGLWGGGAEPVSCLPPKPRGGWSQCPLGACQALNLVLSLLSELVF